MNLITKFNYSRLRNEIHVEYNETVSAIIAKNNPQSLNIVSQYNEYRHTFDVEVSLLDAIRKSEHTAKINEQDRIRDGIFRGISESVKSALHHFDAGKQKAAERISIVLDNYGNIAAKTLDAETAAIDDLLRELNDSCSKEIDIIAIKDWMTQLDIENKKFKELMSTRYAESATRPNVKMKDARNETDKMLRVLLNMINALIVVNGINQYDLLLRELNAVSERYKTQLAQAAGHRHKKENTSTK